MNTINKNSLKEMELKFKNTELGAEFVSNTGKFITEEVMQQHN